jgi:hypothetical protein
VAGTEPPRCAPHGGGRQRIGAPEKNQNRVTHGLFRQPDRPLENLTDVRQRLAGLIVQAQTFLAANITELDVAEIVRILELLGMLLARMARVIKQESETLGASADQFSQEVDEALRLASEYLGADFAH